MKIQQCDRNGCHTLHGKLIRYERIQREFRCKCGCSLLLIARLDNFVVTGYVVTCPDCGVIENIEHYNNAQRGALEAAEVLTALPESFRQLIATEEGPLDLAEVENLLFG